MMALQFFGKFKLSSTELRFKIEGSFLQVRSSIRITDLLELFYKTSVAIFE